MKLKTVEDLVARYDALLVDIDGVLSVGGEYSHPAIELLNNCHSKQVFICTNSVRRTPMHIAQALGDVGYTIDPDRIFTGARSAVGYLCSRGPKVRVYPVGCGDDLSYFTSRGVNFVKSIDNCDVILLGAVEEKDFNLSTCTKIVNRYLDGCKIVATSEDLIVPSANGKYKIGTGFFSIFLKNVRSQGYTLVGKPSKRYFEYVINALNKTVVRKPLMIGDTYHTDIIGAKDCGIDTLYISKAKRRKYMKCVDFSAIEFSSSSQVTSYR